MLGSHSLGVINLVTNQLEDCVNSALVHCPHRVFKLLCREMTDVFITPKLWLPNMLDFNAMDYSILAVL